MSELSERLRKAVEFLRRSGKIRTDKELAEVLRVTQPALSMAQTGRREPTWDLLLTLCDLYPISFDWLRKGEGDMIKDNMSSCYLRRIEELEKKIEELEAEK